jgi:hypothetical protein
MSGKDKGWMEREIKTAQLMIGMFCRRFHQASPCPDCEALLAYVVQRIGKCPYAADKPACSQCPTHCYKPEMRRRIQEVMRFSGPRMIYRHPLAALRHLAGKRAAGGRTPPGRPEADE